LPTQPLLQAPIIQTGLDWLHVQSLMQHSTILAAAFICIPRIRAYPAMLNCIAPDLQPLCSDPHLLCSPAEIGLPPPRLPPLPPALDVRRIQASHDLRALFAFRPEGSRRPSRARPPDQVRPGRRLSALPFRDGVSIALGGEARLSSGEVEMIR